MHHRPAAQSCRQCHAAAESGVFMIVVLRKRHQHFHRLRTASRYLDTQSRAGGNALMQKRLKLFRVHGDVSQKSKVPGL